ncbi:MAG TPA: hypothetical protein VFY87_15130, partial [Geminicoccaceae bacterium]|nr:hypothetical protein [Geminicoccaceae bacterium]
KVVSDEFWNLLVSRDIATPDSQPDERTIAFYFKAGELVVIKNSFWTATSYRTAFSYFLAEHAR